MTKLTVGSDDDEITDEQTRLLESAEEAAAEVESGDYTYDYAPMKEVYKILIGICLVAVIIILVIAIYPSRLPQGGNTSAGSDVGNLENFSQGQTKVTKKPHIIFITASGLGWNDVGWRNWEIRSPNLNHLAKEGVVFNWSYVEDSDGATQAAILSSLYPHFFQANCSSRNATFLPNVLRGTGYKTHMIGAWQLDNKNFSFLPTDIGFDSYFGSIGKVDYYTHGNSYSNSLWKNDKQVDGYNGTFLTDVIADRAVKTIRDHPVDKENIPLFLYLSFQAIAAPTTPPEPYRMPENHPNVWGKRRRVYEMIYALDSAIGRVLDKLRSSGLYENTILVFSTTSGAAVDEAGSNFPLRGGKFTQWEGGTRATTVLRSVKLEKATLGSLFHSVDWLPTLSSAAGVTPNLNNTNGVDYWNLFVDDFVDRSAIMITSPNVKVIRRGRYKLIIGDPVLSEYKRRVWLKLNRTDVNLNCVFNARKDFADDKCKDYDFDLSNSTLLFDLHDDPGELHDISKSRPRLLDGLKLELSKAFEDCDHSDWRNHTVQTTQSGA